MVTEDNVPPASVVTVKGADRAPAATVTVVGTVAFATLELVRLTTAPPVGATPSRITVPVEGLPRTTLVGTNPTE
jgi:hypothetical protein